MKIVFMGTPDFAAAALESLVQAGHEILLVVTQPDKPQGRGKEMQMSAVKKCALEHNLNVFQPIRIKKEENVNVLKEYDADVYVVAAFGQILSQEILDLPPFGCLNIHASLLPKYRGAAPIQWAIINGETESGVTIMQMDAGIDTGDMVRQTKVPIASEDTGETLHDKLSIAGAKLICEVIQTLATNGSVEHKAQNDEESCYASMLDKKMGKMDWSKSAVELERLVRGLNSWPGTYTTYNGKILKIWQSEYVPSDATGAPGTVAAVTKDSIVVNTGTNQLRLLCVQPEGKRKLAVSEFLKGYPVDENTVLI